MSYCLSPPRPIRKPQKKVSFSQPKTSRRKGAQEDQQEEQEEDEEDEDEDEEDEEEDEDETEHGAQSRRMKGRISDQERELLAEKPWALRGEVHSHDRPQNR